MQQQQDWFLSSLRTVFLDDGTEKEGDNIDYNLHEMTKYLAGCARGAGIPALDADDTATDYLRTMRRLTAPCPSDTKSVLEQSHAEPVHSPQRPQGSPEAQPEAETSTASFKPRRARGWRGVFRLLSLGASPIPTMCPTCHHRSDSPACHQVRSLESTDAASQKPPFPFAMHLGTEEAIDSALWNLLSRLECSTSGDLEETTRLVAAHFEGRVGVPPWREYFYKKKRVAAKYEERHSQQVAADQSALRVLQKDLARVRMEVLSLERTMQAVNPIAEQQRATNLLGVLQQEMVECQTQVTRAQEAILDHHAVIQKNRCALARSLDHVRRVVCYLIRAQTLSCRATPTVGSHERLWTSLSTSLQRLPRHGHTKETAMDFECTDPLLCRKCFLLTSNSPFCTVTGDPHVPGCVTDRPASGMDTVSRGDRTDLETSSRGTLDEDEESSEDDLLTETAAEAEAPPAGVTPDEVSIQQSSQHATPRAHRITHRRLPPSQEGTRDGSNRSTPRLGKAPERSPRARAAGVLNSTLTDEHAMKQLPLGADMFASPSPNPTEEETCVRRHFADFMAAATSRDVQHMRFLAGRVKHDSKVSGPLRKQLGEAFEQFTEWAALLISGSVVSHGKRKKKSCGVSELQLVQLKKEVRNLQYAFAKRPKGHSAGAVLDDETFTALALRLVDLEKKNAQLKLRSKMLFAERRVVNSKLSTFLSHCGGLADLEATNTVSIS